MKNHYKTKKISIKSIDKITNILAIFNLSSPDMHFTPGQFFMLSLPGYGEAPFTPTNLPNFHNIEFLIQNKQNGSFTNALFRLKKSDNIYIRGPYGNGFDFSAMKGKNMALFAGGCGLAPVKSALDYLCQKQQNYGQIQLFYGVNTPNEIAYKQNLTKKSKQIELLITVANPDKKYRGNVGFIDKLVDKNTILPNTCAILCGPPVMYKSVIDKLIKLNVKPEDIYLQLERRMHCGVGLCQHCTCGDKYVCLDGPVFRYSEVKSMNNEL